MHTSRMEHSRADRTVGLLVGVVVWAVAPAASATSYVSAEPIPTADVVGQADLDKLVSLDYADRELWGQRLLDECGVVDAVIDALAGDGAISSITGANTHAAVAAGGFEGQTNPSFVLTVQDVGAGAANQVDVAVLSNALGYVLSQGGTAHFSPEDAQAYAFPLNYIVVTFPGTLSGDGARDFFEFVGAIDPALFSGPLAGFTQIDFQGSATNNSMLFLQPDVPKIQFIGGMFLSTLLYPSHPTYYPTGGFGIPKTKRAGIDFPFNDWLAFPDGDGYLGNVPASQSLLDTLADLRQQHLTAVDDLIVAIDQNDVDNYLLSGFACPN